jgi:hypothetical protein
VANTAPNPGPLLALAALKSTSPLGSIESEPALAATHPRTVAPSDGADGKGNNGPVARVVGGNVGGGDVIVTCTAFVISGSPSKIS